MINIADRFSKRCGSFFKTTIPAEFLPEEPDVKVEYKVSQGSPRTESSPPEPTVLEITSVLDLTSKAELLDTDISDSVVAFLLEQAEKDYYGRIDESQSFRSEQNLEY